MSLGQQDNQITANLNSQQQLTQITLSNTQIASTDKQNQTISHLSESLLIAVNQLNKALQLETHLDSLKSDGIITDPEMQEIMSQFYALEPRRRELSSHIGEVVVVYDKELFFGDDLTEALQKVNKKFGSIQKRYYSETIDIPDFPSIYE